jgi:hypothetical protein
MPQLMAKSLVKQNLELWLNDIFLKEGMFQTVSVNETDVYGRDISVLSSMSDESFADNRVWQSAFKEWVYESGISPLYSGVSPPILVSGVTVNGTFYPKDSTAPGYNASFAHTVDHTNGRIIFSSPIAGNSVVKAAFSYKEVTVDHADTFENEQKEFYIETAYKDNPHQTGVITYPEANSRTLPMVLIDILNRTSEPYELGLSAGVSVFQCVLILWSRDSYMRDMIEGILTSRERSTLIGINFNTAPDPLIFRNDRNPAFTNYDTMAQVWSPYFWRRIYIDDISARRIEPYNNIERTQIDLTIRVYPTF